MSETSNTVPKLPDNPTLQELDQFFKHDTFAYRQADCRIVEGWKGHGVAEMVLDRNKHYNAEGRVMGGAIFTLADYAFAAATMCGHASAVAVNSNIEFMYATKGRKLTATCDVDRSGRKLGFYTTVITDDEGESVAKVTATCYHPI